MGLRRGARSFLEGGGNSRRFPVPRMQMIIFPFIEMSYSLRCKCRKVNFNGVQLFSTVRIHLFSTGRSFKNEKITAVSLPSQLRKTNPNLHTYSTFYSRKQCGNRSTILTVALDRSLEASSFADPKKHKFVLQSYPKNEEKTFESLGILF